MNNAAAALIFTGQGGQHAGMGKNLYDVSSDFKKMIDDASNILDLDFASLFFYSSEQELSDTLHSQLATFVYEAGIYEMIKARGLLKDVEFVVGHSIGEYAALYAADSLTFENALKLINTRAKLCNEVNKKNPASLMAVIGCTEEEIKSIFDNNRVFPAIINSPTQLVVAGLIADLEKTKEYVADKFSKRCIMLNVSGGYHSPLMQEAFENFKDPLNNTLINDAKIELIGNTTATTMWRADDIFDELRYQLIEPVKWFESMELLYDQEDIRNYIEIGPKPVLAKLIKMTHPDVNVITVSGE